MYSTPKPKHANIEGGSTRFIQLDTRGIFFTLKRERKVKVRQMHKIKGMEHVKPVKEYGSI
jgi:hypothetical protein